MQQKRNQEQLRNALQQQLFPKMQKKIEYSKVKPKRAIRIEDANNRLPQTFPQIEPMEIDFQAKYRLGERIGQGAHGVVKQAIKEDTGEIVAVKISSSGDPELVKTFTEAYKNARMLNHQYIIKVYECYIDEQTEALFLVMEYSNLRSLEEVMRHTKLTEEQIKILIRHILLALQHIHERGVAHRDLKPDNILIDQNSLDIKIIDFGVSRRFKKYNGREFIDVDMWTRTGNVYYTAPEILIGGGYNEKVDLWSLGVCLFRILSGNLPFFKDSVLGTTKMILKGKFELNHSISHLARDFIRRLLNPNPLQRLSAQLALQHPWLYCQVSDRLSLESSQHPKSSYRTNDDIKDFNQFEKKNSYYSRNLHMRSNTMSKSPIVQHDRQISPKSPLEILQNDIDGEIQQSPLIKLKKIQHQMSKEINIIRRNKQNEQGFFRFRMPNQFGNRNLLQDYQ
ncbi:unnamed protein product (macronuclear) [Paramecium tetraurelia]|uniref:Protein kinase domain-containing protein n=1 Tax=Paramecium tetraurelia TaxID=5888 RepID=A0BHK1_PARTE|nr:uncharacterized protein GSPATT00029053001 [Paramecium tetraurelia]CAK58018.1 unnamed protein product [Paramecium tetraurelia]|eukprot:XP_001425416.1 hypothetical protein (macronuclear) [Paramecium tetraurelia strain d4-2]